MLQIHSLVYMQVELEAHTKLACLFSSDLCIVKIMRYGSQDSH